MSGLDPAVFRRALGRFGSGVTVVTVRTADGSDHGMTASAFSSLSLAPPLVLVAVKRAGTMHGLLAAAQGFAINVLSEHQQELSNRFAGGLVGSDGVWRPWPPERDKFEGLSFDRGATSGAALITGCLASLDCAVHATPDGGDHTLFIGEVRAITLADVTPLRPLLHFAGGYRRVAADANEELADGLRVPDWYG